MNRHVLSILVDDNAGVLSRIAGLFTRRGYNIQSLSVGGTQDENISRITIVVVCDDIIPDAFVKADLINAARLNAHLHEFQAVVIDRYVVRDFNAGLFLYHS